MDNIKVSIIVPVYNNENYIEKCIHSLLNQTEKNIEIIIVDDGSTDNSYKICERIARDDNRVVLIHQDNSGVSSARNNGIMMAKGEYVGFVDSDDWIVEEMYATLYSKAIEEEADIVMCDAETIYTDGRTEEDTFYTLEDMSILTKDLSAHVLVEIAGAVWRAIYRKKLIIENNVLFQENIKFSEDRIFNLQLMSKMNKLVYIKKAFYKRLVHDSSAVHSFHEDYFERVLISYSRIRDVIKNDWNDNEKIKEVYAKQFINGVYCAINNCFLSDSTLSYKEKIKKIKFINNNNILIDSILLIKNKNFKEKILQNKCTYIIICLTLYSNFKTKLNILKRKR